MLTLKNKAISRVVEEKSISLYVKLQVQVLKDK